MTGKKILPLRPGLPLQLLDDVVYQFHFFFRFLKLFMAAVQYIHRNLKNGLSPSDRVERPGEIFLIFSLSGRGVCRYNSLPPLRG